MASLGDPVADFFRSLMGQPAGNDQMSPFEQLYNYQMMMKKRAQTGIPTIDPGTTWGGMDKNNIQPGDVMSNGKSFQLENI